jgi:G3E family GTPase
LQTFATDRALGDTFHVDILATVVDAATGETTLEWSAEARKQVILADRLIVTKTDLKDAVALIAKLRALNPRAPITTAKEGKLEPGQLTEPASTERSSFVAEAEHSDGIGSFVWRRSEPVQWQSFSRAMETLTALRGPGLLRVKGFLDVEGCNGPALVQFVQHLAHPPVELESWRDGPRESRLVFITRNLPEEKVRALFAAVEGLA